MSNTITSHPAAVTAVNNQITPKSAEKSVQFALSGGGAATKQPASLAQSPLLTKAQLADWASYSPDRGFNGVARSSGNPNYGC